MRCLSDSTHPFLEIHHRKTSLPVFLQRLPLSKQSSYASGQKGAVSGALFRLWIAAAAAAAFPACLADKIQLQKTAAATSPDYI